MTTPEEWRAAVMAPWVDEESDKHEARSVENTTWSAQIAANDRDRRHSRALQRVNQRQPRSIDEEKT